MPGVGSHVGMRKLQAREPEVEEVLDLGAEPGDLLDAGGDVGVEERPRHDPQRQRRHLVVEVDVLRRRVHASTLSCA